MKKMNVFDSASIQEQKYDSMESFIEKIIQDYNNSDQRFDLSYYEKTNMKMKDEVFRYIFGEPEKFSDLYHSLSGIKIPAESFTRYDLDSKLLFGLENDISFLTKDKSIIVLVEQQSTLSPNMPVRCLVYYSNLIRRLCEEDKTTKENMFSKFLNIPEPEFYILYNGEGKVEESTSKLSSHFKIPFGRTESKKRHMIEVEVKNIDIHYKNLNTQKKKKLPDYPMDLYGYSFLIDTYDYYRTELKKKTYKEMFYKKLGYSSIEEVNSVLLNNLINRRALDLAITMTEKKCYLVDYLGREEFRFMLEEKMTLDEFKRIMEERGKEEGRAEGRAEGRRTEKIQMVLNMSKNGIDIKTIAVCAELSEEDVKKILEGKNK